MSSRCLSGICRRFLLFFLLGCLTVTRYPSYTRCNQQGTQWPVPQEIRECYNGYIGAESFSYTTLEVDGRVQWVCLTLEEMKTKIEELDQVASNSPAGKLQGYCYHPSITYAPHQVWQSLNGPYFISIRAMLIFDIGQSRSCTIVSIARLTVYSPL